MLVQEERVFESFLRKDSFSQAGNKDNFKRTGGRLVEGPNKNLSITPVRRLRSQEPEPICQDLSHLAEADGSDLAPGLPPCEYGQYGLGLPGGHARHFGKR